jgi:hypothetical protein
MRTTINLIKILDAVKRKTVINNGRIEGRGNED